MDTKIYSEGDKSNNNEESTDEKEQGGVEFAFLYMKI